MHCPRCGAARGSASARRAEISLVLRTVYIERAVDDRLRDEAQQSGISKAELFRRYLRAGVRAVRADRGLAASRPLPAGAEPLLLRTVHIDDAVDAWLRVQAFDLHVPKSEYTRWCLSLGMR